MGPRGQILKLEENWCNSVDLRSTIRMESKTIPEEQSNKIIGA